MSYFSFVFWEECPQISSELSTLPFFKERWGFTETHIFQGSNVSMVATYMERNMYFSANYERIIDSIGEYIDSIEEYIDFIKNNQDTDVRRLIEYLSGKQHTVFLFHTWITDWKDEHIFHDPTFQKMLDDGSIQTRNISFDDWKKGVEADSPAMFDVNLLYKIEPQ